MISSENLTGAALAAVIALTLALAWQWLTAPRRRKSISILSRHASIVGEKSHEDRGDDHAHHGPDPFESINERLDEITRLVRPKPLVRALGFALSIFLGGILGPSLGRAADAIGGRAHAAILSVTPAQDAE